MEGGRELVKRGWGYLRKVYGDRRDYPEDLA